MTAFDPDAWLAKAEGKYGYRLSLVNGFRDGKVGLCIEEPDPEDRQEDETALWRELRPGGAASDANERALREHLRAIGRIAG